MTTEVAIDTGTSSQAKLWAFVLLWAALIAQVAWILVEHFRSGVAVAEMWYPLAAVVACLLLAMSNGRIRWIATLLRVLIGIAFLQAVCDRFGLLGGAGTPGVAWGNFANFVAYTGKVNSFLPHSTIFALAVLETIIETILGIAMLLGIRIRETVLGSAALLFLFATAMTVSGLSQFSYAVYLLCVGALVLATTNASLLSVDAMISRART